MAVWQVQYGRWYPRLQRVYEIRHASEVAYTCLPTDAGGCLLISYPFALPLALQLVLQAMYVTPCMVGCCLPQ